MTHRKRLLIFFNLLLAAFVWAGANHCVLEDMFAAGASHAHQESEHKHGQSHSLFFVSQQKHNFDLAEFQLVLFFSFTATALLFYGTLQGAFIEKFRFKIAHPPQSCTELMRALSVAPQAPPFLAIR